jgi:hypothetical protein
VQDRQRPRRTHADAVIQVVPVPMPSETDVLLTPPDQAEVDLIVRGLFTATRSTGGWSPLQEVVLAAAVEAMTGFVVAGRPGDRVPLGPDGLAEALARRNRIFRERILQTMILGALVVDPLPEEVGQQISACATAMGVSDDMLTVLQDLAHGDRGLALVDFERSGYTAGWASGTTAVLHAAATIDGPWGAVRDDPTLAARWEALAECPEGSLGLHVWRFYKTRGFRFPGSPGSAPPYLAQHDWVHVLADYGSTVESELEVFGLIARATDDPRGFSFLAMVVGLFETGSISRGAGLFEADEGHLRREGMAVRLADAMRRGALTHGDQRLLDRDWFADAHRPVEDVRAEIGLVPKSDNARAEGSRGPFEPGSLSPFQHDAGLALAAEEQRAYQTWAD